MKFYATSDFHGHYNLYKKIKETVDPQDIIYVLGDCADRGPNGWKTLKAVIEDPQCILLMGNHEHMLMKSMEDFFNAPDEYTINDDSRLEYIYGFSENFDLLRWNGGELTLLEWFEEPNKYYWYSRLKHLTTVREIMSGNKHLILTHAGFDPHRRPDDDDYENILWDREHFVSKWPEGYENTYIIHGHTPNFYLTDCLFNIDRFAGRKQREFDILCVGEDGNYVYNCTYANGHKICIDPGTIISKRGILLDLDTLEQKAIEFNTNEEAYAIEEVY